MFRKPKGRAEQASRLCRSGLVKELRPAALNGMEAANFFTPGLIEYFDHGFARRGSCKRVCTVR